MSSKIDYQVVDNFLDRDDFEKLHDEITSAKTYDFPWYFQQKINDFHTKEDTSFYLTHIFFINNQRNSSYYNLIVPIIEKIKPKALIRIKANCYTNSKVLEIHEPHSDCPYSHIGCVFSINTCDGKTILNDGTEIASVANRALFFDASIMHSSTNTTNTKARFNINFNYF